MMLLRVVPLAFCLVAVAAEPIPRAGANDDPYGDPEPVIISNTMTTTVSAPRFIGSATACTSVEADTVTVSISVPMDPTTLPAVTFKAMPSIKTVSVDVPTTVMAPAVVVTNTLSLVTTSLVTVPAPPPPPADVFTVTVTTTLCSALPLDMPPVPNVDAMNAPKPSILTLPLAPIKDEPVPNPSYGGTGVPDVVPMPGETTMPEITVPVEPTTTTTMISTVNVSPMPVQPTTLSTTTVMTTVGSTVRTAEVVKTRPVVEFSNVDDPEMTIMPVPTSVVLRPVAPTVVVDVPVVTDVASPTYGGNEPSTLITEARPSVPTDQFGGLPNVVEEFEDDDDDDDDDNGDDSDDDDGDDSDDDNDEYGGDDTDDDMVDNMDDDDDDDDDDDNM